MNRDRLDQHRTLYAQMMAAASGSPDPRIARVFELVPREAFMPPGPWHLMVNGRFVQTPSDDPALLYQNVLVALDRARGINNGEPALHAAWLGAVAPQPGETAIHVGAGTGYYTAILSRLVAPGGHVTAYEIEPGLAAQAVRNLAPFEGVEVVAGDATALDLRPADILYVNAGLAAPPPGWLDALRPDGRLIFPWQPLRGGGPTLLVTRRGDRFAVRPLMLSLFIGCAGTAAPAAADSLPAPEALRAVRSLWRTADRPPDGSAVAVYDAVWFSHEEI